MGGNTPPQNKKNKIFENGKEKNKMTQYGKIYIEANSIEEAERELEMIKSLVRLGAVKGQGSTSTGKIEMEMRPTSANGYVAEAPSDNYRCTDCSICPRRCREETYHPDDFDGTDDYEEDEEAYAIIDTIGRLATDYSEGGVNIYEFLDGIRSALLD